MKLNEIVRLDESITFSVARLKDEGGRKIYDTAEFQKEVEAECWVCDGKGKDPHHTKHGHDVECEMCKGSGKVKEYKTEFGELNVANSNAFEILSMLGVEQDYAGAIEKKDLANIRRRLIMIKNKGVEDHTSDTEVSQGKPRATKDDNGISRISRGPTVHNIGRTNDQVMRYIDKLLNIIDFAQKNDAIVVWN